MPALVFLLAACGLAALVFWLVRRNRRILDERNLLFSVQARHSGWRFQTNPEFRSVTVTNDSEGGPSGREEDDIEFTIDGVAAHRPWRMWHDAGRRFRTGNGQSTPRAIWACDELRTPRRALMILPRWQYRFESGRIIGAIEGAVSLFTRAIAEQMGREPDTDSRQAFFKRAVEIKGALAGFEPAFVVLAGPDLPRDWLDDELQAMLLRWPQAGTRHAVAVELGPDGLLMTFADPAAQSWPFWDQFGRLGSTLAERLAPR